MVVQVESKRSGEAVCKLKKIKYAVREPIKREKGGRVYKVVTRECKFSSSCETSLQYESFSY